MSKKVTQCWSLTIHGHCHRVEVQGSVVRTARWYVDDELVATKRSVRDNVSLEAVSLIGCAIGLELGVLWSGGRATLFEGEDHVEVKELVTTGTGGVDLEPEPGSPAARREQRIREHPWRHVAIATVVGVARVVVPLVMGLVVVRCALILPWPQWSVPWPDLDIPRIPWPEIPWPAVHLPNWEPPQWARWVARTVRHGWPVLLALVIARIEIERRREQDARRAELERGSDQAPAPDEDEPETAMKAGACLSPSLESGDRRPAASRPDEHEGRPRATAQG